MESPDISGVSGGIKESVKANLKDEREKEKVPPSCTVGVSISESPDLSELGFTSLHVQDAMVEIARYLLVNNCKLIYGGDLRKGGYTFIFSELARLYSRPENQNAFRIANYFAWPIHLNMLRSDDSEFKANYIQIEKLPLPDGIDIDKSIFIKPDTFENKVIWAKSLSYMREVISEVSQSRILIGGQVKNFMGRIPGLLEEAVLSIRSNKPVYLCGALGGATKAIGEAIIKGESDVITDGFQFENKEYNEFHDRWNETQDNKISFSELTKELGDFGVKGLSNGNGLNEEDNLRLLQTPHITEMIYLILKGLKAKKIL